MTAIKLDHVNLRTTQLDKMIVWYTSVLGLSVGARPNFAFAGAWLYAGKSALIHLVAIDELAVGSEASLKLEHMAFCATDKVTFVANLGRLNIAYKATPVAEFNLIQYNLWDPDGNHIHVDFFDDK